MEVARLDTAAAAAGTAADQDIVAVALDKAGTVPAAHHASVPSAAAVAALDHSRTLTGRKTTRCNSAPAVHGYCDFAHEAVADMWDSAGHSCVIGSEMLEFRVSVPRPHCRKPGLDWRLDRMTEELDRCRHPSDHSKSSRTLAVGDSVRCQFC